MTTATEPRQAWRCTGCGRVANSVAKPSSHRREGKACGPFTSAVVAEAGAVITAAREVLHGEVLDPVLRYRQSRLAAYADGKTGCPRSTVLAPEFTTGGIGSSADLGSAFHAVAAEVLRTLRRQGETTISTQEAVEILREVVGRGPWVLSPTDWHGDGGTVGIVQMVCNMAGEEWKPSRIMAIEQRLFCEILCPDGEIRRLTGTPDAVFSDADSLTPGIVIPDHKTGLAKPKDPKITPEPGQAITGAQYLTEGGYTQAAIYWVLAANEWPRAQRMTWREKNWRYNGAWREAIFTREDLEHLIPWVADVMMKLDRGLREGDGSEYAQPRPGKRCLTRCSVSVTCPVPQEQRGVGAITTPAEADELAARWRVIRALDPQMRKTLKAIHEETGHCPDGGGGEVVRWDGVKGEGRSFGFHPPANPEADAASSAAVEAEYMAQWEAEHGRRGLGAVA